MPRSRWRLVPAADMWPPVGVQGAADPGVLLDQQHAGAERRGLDRAGDAPGAGSDDDEVVPLGSAHVTLYVPQ
ncbi:hypothetical protein Acsp03_40140 [Actinomadura sp. NBRC 104412]|nr:hypothetical protein Acsp03_40140 [Actinomadura sp. NBRC 104412]